MAAKVGGVIIGMRADTAQFESDLGKANAVLSRQVTAMSTKLDGLGRSFKGVEAAQNKQAAALGKWVGRMAAAAAVTLPLAIIKRTLDAADALDALSKKTGMGVERLQTLAYAADQMGTSSDTLSTALSQLRVNAGKAIDGNKELSEVFKVLGVDMAKLASGKMSQEELFNTVANGVSKVSNLQQQAALTAAVFGKAAGPEMLAMLEKGSAGIKEQEDRLRELGGVVSGEANAKLDAFGDTIAELKKVLDAKMARAIAENTDALLGLGSAAITLFDNFAKGLGVMKSFAEMMERIVANNTGLAKAALIYKEYSLSLIPGSGHFGDFNFSGAAAEADKWNAEHGRAGLPQARPDQTGMRIPVIDRTGRTGGGAIVIPSTGGSSRKKSPTAMDKLNAGLPAPNFVAERMMDSLRAIGVEFDNTAKAAEDAAAAEKDRIESLFKDAEAVKDSLDPTREFARETEHLKEMFDAGALNATELSAALEKNNEALAAMQHEALLASHSISGVFARAQDSATDALTSIDWVSGNTAKQIRDVWKQTANQIINDLLKMLTSVQGQSGGSSGGFLSNLLGIGMSLFGGSSGTALGAAGGGFVVPDSNPGTDWIKGLASGGPVIAGNSYMVGESGREMFTPANDGTITPNSALKSMVGKGDKGVSVAANFNFYGQTNQDTIRRSMGQIEHTLTRAVQRGMRQA